MAIAAALLGTTGLPLTASGCTPAPSGLISWWRAEGDTQDAVGANIGALLGNTGFASGEVGQAFSVNGSGGGVDCGTPANLELQHFTIEAWIKRASSTKATWDIFNHGHVVSWVWGGFGFGLWDNGQIFLDKVGYASVTSTAALTDTNSFHHIAVTKFGTNVVLYLDGVGETMPPFDPGFVFNGTFCIGTRGSDHVTSFLGLVDEASVYNRALSAGEIQAIYAAGSAGKCLAPALPVITSQPMDLTVTVGQSATFMVAATANGPLSYQWRFNGQPLTNQTSTALVLTGVQQGDAGNYAVLVSNGGLSLLSSNAVLTVLPNSTNCTPAPAGLVSWWRGENNPLDSVSSNNGTLLGNTAFAPCEVGEGFSINGSGGGVDCGTPANLELQDFTIEAWIKRGSSTKATWDVFNHGHVVSWVWGGFGFGLFDNGQLFLDKVGYASVASTTTLTDTTIFHHIAVTKAGTNVVLYIDGLGETMPPFDPGFVFNGTFCIGTRGSDHVTSFLGLVDEASVYNRALSAAEIQAIYAAGSAGKCPGATLPVITSQPTNVTVTAGQTAAFTVAATGTGSLSYQWQFNGQPLTNQTSTALMLADVQLSDAGNYAVLVSDAAGSVLSSNAVLTVLSNTTNCIPAPEGLISWWRAEGNALDFVSGNNGTLLGNTGFAPGEVGQAFSVNGSGGGVDYGTPTDLELQDFTIEAWIKRGSSTKATWDVFNHGHVVSWVWGGFGLGLFDNGQLFLDKVGYASVQSTGAITDTNYFHHIAVTKSGSNVVLFIDGVPEQMPPFDPGFVFNGTFCIGTRGSDHVTSFLGLVDEASVYDRALSATEIQSIYSAGGAGKCAVPLVPVITSQPTNVTVSVGGTATFSVAATGNAPIFYQWQFSGQPLTNETSAALVLTDVQLSDAGNYAVLVSNAAGSVLSSNAVLAVLANPTNCTSAPDGLISWWRSEGNALDFVSGNDGTLLGNTASGPGEVGRAFSINGSGGGLDCGAPANLELQDFTIEAWIKRGSSTKATWDVFNHGHVVSWVWGGFGFGLFDNGQLFLDKVGYASVASTATLTDTTIFHHIAVTKSGSNVVLYIDGVGETMPPFDPGFVFNGTFCIGTRGSDHVTSFLGLVDEASVYDRALSATEIQSIYSAGGAGKCAVPTPPLITSQPTNLTVTVGETATFTVTAGGSQPLSYQWQFNSQPLTNQTSAALMLTDIQLSEAGNYAVLVSNAVGQVLSSNAALIVQPNTTNCTPAPEGLVSWWRGEGNADDALGVNNGTLINGVTFAPGEVGQAFDFNGGAQYVQVPNSPSLNPANAITIETWVYPTNVPATDSMVIVGKDDAASERQYDLALVTSGTGLAFRPHVGVPGGFIFYTGTTPVSLNHWYHVALTYDGTTLKLYVNGVQDGSLAVTGPVLATSQPLCIGGLTSGPWYFRGLIDEVSLYSRALSATEIEAIYAAGSAGKCPPPPPVTCDPPPANLVGWWKAEGNALDAVGTNDGTLLANTEFAPGEVGQAFSINGSGGGVDCGRPADLELQDFTIEAWIKRGSSTKATWDIYNHGHVVSWVWGGFGFGLFDDGHLFLDKVGYASVASTTTLTDTNSFHHIAVTKSGSNVVLYIDGVGEMMPPFNPGFVFNGTFCIGTRGSDHVTSFLGLVDEASVYNRALSATEIQAIYAAGGAGKCSGTNHPPVAGTAFVKVLTGEVTLIPSYRFLDYCSDPDGDTLSISAVSSPSTNGGTVTLAPDGVVYVPPTNYVGADEFRYTVTDGLGGTASAAMEVLIEARGAAAAAMLQPMASSNGMQIRFNGFADRSYSIERAQSLNGPWIVVGTALTDDSGNASFVDPNPPGTCAYYRAVYR
ncbi:MAG TPA: LamG-like jellyroll fold domain-containing protein [Verrucomicrobiae bacterium]|nr:LamG-like jellyroll fold domain-containing protein [Verrucomicrobiae bacterium]